MKGEGGLTIEKTAAKRIDNENHKVYIDYTITLNAVRRNTNVKIEDVISAAMNEQNKNGNILSWELTGVQGNGCAVAPDFFKVEDDKRSAGGTIAEMPAGSSVTIQYTIEVSCVGEITDSAVKDYEQLKATKTFTNTAQLLIDEATYPPVTADAEVEPPAVASKEQTYTQESHPIVHYSISINPEKLDLIPEGQDQTFTLTDSIGPALRFMEDSLEVNGKAWDGEVTFQGNTMQIHGLQDATAYEITYKARIVLDSGTDFGGDGWNKVELSPIEIPGENQSSTELTGQVLEATAGGESKTLKVSIYKTDDSGDPVKDAEFTLYSYGTGSELTEKGTPVEGGILTSGENGETSQIEVQFDMIYRFVETGVPAGYEKGDDLPYFVRPSSGSGVQYEEGVEVLTGYQEYQFTAVNRKVSTTDIAVEKIWDDANDQDGLRPDAIVVHLYADGEDTGKVLTLNEENGWKGTFSQLAEYAGGEKIAYTVKEDAVDGYTSETGGDAVKGYVITNTHTPAPTPTPVQPADPQTPSAGTPQTGDASMPALWLALTALSGTGFAFVQIARTRARRRGR